jgi:signal peptide peptidase SppA
MGKAKNKIKPLTKSAERCRGRHFGAWMAEPKWLEAEVAAAKENNFKGSEREGSELKAQSEYEVDSSDRIAIVSIGGMMTKGDSKFGGTSTLRTRTAIRKAISDPGIRSLVLHIDSPGGTVAGTHELAKDVAAAARIKPVHAHIDDLGASAAYWIASQATDISVNEAGEVGSIGAFALIYDTSAAMNTDGVKVHRVATGPLKGAGSGGTPVPKELLEAEQEIVDRFGKMFADGVNFSRNTNLKIGEGAADGRMFHADAAKELGLVDTVQNFEDRMDNIRSSAMDTTEQIAELRADQPSLYKAISDAAFADGKEQVKAANSTAVAAETESAVQDERDRCHAIACALSGRDELLQQSIKDGTDVVSSKAAMSDALIEENKQLQATIARNESPESDALTVGISKSGDNNTVKEPDDCKTEEERTARAKWEWANDSKAFDTTTEKTYVTLRTRQLAGTFRIKMA